VVCVCVCERERERERVIARSGYEEKKRYSKTTGKAVITQIKSR
jgi:hypothetical protein